MSGFTRFYGLKFVSNVCPPLITDIDEKENVDRTVYVAQFSVICTVSEQQEEVLDVALTLSQLEELKR